MSAENGNACRNPEAYERGSGAALFAKEAGAGCGNGNDIGACNIANQYATKDAIEAACLADPSCVAYRCV